MKNNQELQSLLELFKKIGLVVLLLSSSINIHAQSETGMVPFVIDHRQAEDSRIDLSFLLDAPAGGNGFISIEDGHMVDSNGKKQRFWGVNITDWTRGSVQIPTKEESKFWARTLARFGVNIVRLTFLDFFTPRGIIDPNRNNTRHLDSLQLDKLDYWIYELKEQGIYTDLNLLVGRTFKEGDSVADYDKIGWGKYASYFDPQLIKLQKEFAEKLLTHYNPYTETEYRSEPAIAIVELVNENTLFDAWHRDALHPAETQPMDPNFKPLTAHYSDLLTQQFNQYLTETKNEEELAILRKQANVGAGEQIPRFRKADYDKIPEELFQEVVSFYMHIERDYFEKMNIFLKDSLGVKSLLIGSNDFLHNQSEYPMMWTNSALDILDGHVYWQHPSWPGKINTPMVNEPDSSTVAKLSRTAIAGKPYTVSEVNNAFPNDYEAEGIPIIAAYGSLQDWDAIMWYTFEPKSDPDYKPYVGDAFDISHHPVKMPQLAAGALMYLRNDVREANKMVIRSYSKKQLAETMRMSLKEHPYYTPGFPISLVLQNQVRIGSLEGGTTQGFPPDPENPIISDTQELKWDTTDGTGLVSVDSPRSQALIGFINTNTPSLGNLAVKVNNEFCAITLSSLDAKPLANTSRMLLTAGARVENEGQQWNEDRTNLKKRGKSPSLIEPVTGEITLLNIVGSVAILVTPLDGSGNPMSNARNARKSDAGWIFSIGEPATTWYEIKVSR